MAVAAQRPIPDMAEFDSIHMVTFGLRFINRTPDVVQWCRRYGLLAQNMECPACNVPCTEGIYRRAVDGVAWRRPTCRKTINIRKGSFFEKSHLQLWQILALTYQWATNAGRSRGLGVDRQMAELEIGSRSTIVDWNQFCRDVAVQYFLNHPERLGGRDSIVEIDESLFARRKYNRGHVVREQWIMGGYDVERKIGFLIPVARRDAATLLPIIVEWVHPGSIVWSDMWAAYNQLGNNGFHHGTVNHELHFVDPGTGVTTNRVEAMWQRAKAKFKAMFGPTNREMIPDYLAEFMWMQRFRDHPFYHFWTQVATDLYIV